MAVSLIIKYNFANIFTFSDRAWWIEQIDTLFFNENFINLMLLMSQIISFFKFNLVRELIFLNKLTNFVCWLKVRKIYFKSVYAKYSLTSSFCVWIL